MSSATRIVARRRDLALVAGVAPISPRAKRPAARRRARRRRASRLGDLDRAADPCTDFYAFANGAWRAANPIPAGTQRWSRRLAAREANRQQLKALLEELAAKGGPASRKRRAAARRSLRGVHGRAGDRRRRRRRRWRRCSPTSPAVRDEPGVERIDPPAARAGRPGPVRGHRRLGLPRSREHRREHRRRRPGLARPRLLPEARAVASRRRARGIEPTWPRVLTLGGMAAAPRAKAADEILALETRLAEASLAARGRRRPGRDRAQADVRAARAARSALRLGELLRGGRAPADRRQRRRARVPRATGPRARVDARGGVEGLPDLAPARVRVALAVEAVRRGVLRLQGQVPRRRHGDEAPRDALSRVDGGPARRAARPQVRRALLSPRGEGQGPGDGARPCSRSCRTRSASSSGWLRATRQQALAKLAAYDVKVGYPDVVDRLLGARHSPRRVLGRTSPRPGGSASTIDRRRVGQRASRAIWQLPPSSPDAYIDVQLNLMALPAGFLQAAGVRPRRHRTR